MRDNSEHCEARYQAATTPATSGAERTIRGRKPDHSIYTLKRAMNTLGGRGLRVFDGRTALGKAAQRWRSELVRDLGGDVSTQQATIIELALRTKTLLDSIDAWLVQQPSIILKRKRSLMPVVTQRQVLADALARYLQALGLERKAKPLPSLDDYLSGRIPPGEEAEKQPAEQGS